MLYAFFPTRLSLLRVSLSPHISLYTSPFLYKRGTGETWAAEPRAKPRAKPRVEALVEARVEPQVEARAEI